MCFTSYHAKTRAATKWFGINMDKTIGSRTKIGTKIIHLSSQNWTIICLEYYLSWVLLSWVLLIEKKNSHIDAATKQNIHYLTHPLMWRRINKCTISKQSIFCFSQETIYYVSRISLNYVLLLRIFLEKCRY